MYIIFFAFCRRFFSVRSHKWQKAHSAPFLPTLPGRSYITLHYITLLNTIVCKKSYSIITYYKLNSYSFGMHRDVEAHPLAYMKAHGLQSPAAWPRLPMEGSSAVPGAGSLGGRGTGASQRPLKALNSLQISIIKSLNLFIIIVIIAFIIQKVFYKLFQIMPSPSILLRLT